MRAAKMRPILKIALCAGGMLAPESALAHAFGARYDLPLPLDMYLMGAGAAVAMSFVVMALVVRARRHALPTIGFFFRGPWAVAARGCSAVASCVSVALLLLIIAAGLAGNSSPVENLAPVMVWVVWWVGFVFATALVANFWVVFNPWDAVARWGERVGRTWRVCESLPATRTYPTSLGAWPAVGLFAAFAWLELVSQAGERPATLAWLIISYSAFTWSGCLVFGREAWMSRGDMFSQVLAVYGRMAPVHIVRSSGDAPARIVVRPYAAGLAEAEPVTWPMLLLVITMLATVSFDGFMETPAWQAVIAAVETSRWLRPALLALQDRGVDLLQLVTTLALLSSIAIFAGAFVAFTWLAAVAGQRRVPFAVLCRALVLSLVPIAIAYHVAHYLSYLMLAGQLVIPLASDPFGFGWNLFWTAGYRIDISVIDAQTVWYVAVAAIVVGHVVAVSVAHMIALRLHAEPVSAILSQLPMTVLMVLYTMASLWMLAQPVVSL